MYQLLWFVITNITLLIFKDYYSKIIIAYIVLIIIQTIISMKNSVKEKRISEKKYIFSNFALIPFAILYFPIFFELSLFPFQEMKINSFVIMIISTSLLSLCISEYLLITFRERQNTIKNLLIIGLSSIIMIFGFYFQIDFNIYVFFQLCITGLLIGVILMGKYSSCSRFLLIFLIINYRIQYIYLYMIDKEMLKVVNMDISLGYNFDIWILISIIILNNFKNIKLISNKDFNKIIKIFITGIGFAICLLILNTIILCDVSAIIYIINSFIKLFFTSQKIISEPSITIILFMLNILLTGYFYYTSLKKMKFSAMESIIVILPPFFYTMFL